MIVTIGTQKMFKIPEQLLEECSETEVKNILRSSNSDISIEKVHPVVCQNLMNDSIYK